MKREEKQIVLRFFLILIFYDSMSAKDIRNALLLLVTSLGEDTENFSSLYIQFIE